MLNTDQHTNLRPRSKVLNSLLVVGGVVILAVLISGIGMSGAFGGLKPASFYLLSNAASAIESLSLLFKPESTLVVLPSDRRVNSGDFFTLAFSRSDENGTGGEYAISYPCAFDFILEHLSDNRMKELDCSRRVVIGDASLTGVTLRAILENSESLAIPITLHFRGIGENAGQELSAQTLITVARRGDDGSSPAAQSSSVPPEANANANANKTNATSSLLVGNTGGNTAAHKPGTSVAASLPKNTIPASVPAAAAAPKAGAKTEKTFVYYSTGPTASDPAGTIDLEPRILEVGFVDRTTNVFTASSSPSADLRVAVRFEIINNGTKASGSWSFNAVLPTMPFYIYSGDTQQSLLPGEKIEFITGFDSVLRKKDGEFIVNVDPASRVVESNESNNIVKILIHPAF